MMTKRKVHMRTGGNGLTLTGESDDSIALIGNEEELGLKPNTGYTIIIHEGMPEGEPEPEYPRCFVPKGPNSLYWYFPNSNSHGHAVFADGAISPVTVSLQEVIENPYINEVSYEEAERHIGRWPQPRREPEPEPKPEKCVWYQDPDTLEIEPLCTYSPDKVLGHFEIVDYCPWCRNTVEITHDISDSESSNNPEPEIPDGFRVLEDWEIEVAAELGLPKPEQYCIQKNQYAVPENWSPLPECGEPDCVSMTELAQDGEDGMYYLWCEQNPNSHRIGRKELTKTEAIKAYPRKEG